MYSITANDLKTKGAALFSKALSNELEVTITVRGKPTYVIMPIEQYHHYRESELLAALAETQADIAGGRIFKDTVAEHIKRVKPACLH